MHVLSFATFIVEDMFWPFTAILVASTILFMMDEDEFSKRSRNIAFGIHGLALVIMAVYIITYVTIQ